MWSDRLIRLLFPPRCLLCDRVVRSFAAICCDCAEYAPLLHDQHLCKKCSRPIGEEHFLCQDCLVHLRYFTASFAAATYEGDLRKALLRFKFHARPDMMRGFGRLILSRLGQEEFLPRFDFAIGVPMTKRRIKARGYNQSELLARMVAPHLHIPFVRNVIRKIRETAPQSALPYHERLTNLRGAFRVSQPELVKNKRILLVDDIFTTGATTNEVSKTLLRAGAKEVYVAVVAVTPYH